MKKVDYVIENSIVFLFVLSIASSFLSMSSYNSGLPIFAFMISVMLLLQHVKSNIIKSAGVFIALLVYMYAYLNQGQNILTWLTTLHEQVQTDFSIIYSNSIAIIPNTFGVVLIGLFIILMFVLTLTFKKWKIAFLIQLSYYLILIGLNQIRVTNHILLFVFSSLMLAAWQIIQQTNTREKTLKIMASLTAILSILVISSYQIPHSFPVTYQQIQTQTIEMRRELSNSLFKTLEKLGDSTGLTLQSGFSENDSYLGGPMTTSERLVYETVQEQPTYWRIESKAFYTSKGWESRSMPNEMMHSPYNINFGFERYSSETKTVRFTTSRDGITFIPLPYGNVTVYFSDDFYRFNSTFYESENHRIRTDNLPENDLIDVVIQYQSPIYYEQDLINSVASTSTPGNPYVQLPSTLPSRVAELALSITKDAKNDYEKVTLIEAFLRDGSNYTYTLKNAEYVPNTRDYVDFFLFDTQRGYCNHFSSAMTVMLRTLNIQARWVKGYSPGQEQITSLTNQNEYRITEANAHAWVEVYFENIGWVPFEPTPSFSLDHEGTSTPMNNPSENDELSSPINPLDSSNSDDISFDHEANNRLENGFPSEGDEEWTIFDAGTPSFTASDNFVWVKLFGLMLVLGGILYYLRSYLILLFIKYHFHKNNATSLRDLARLLYRALEIVDPKESSDTYLEYVRKLDWLNTHKSLIDFTRQVDAIVFGNYHDECINQEHVILFDGIIKQCLHIVKQERMHQLNPRNLLQSSGLIRFRK